MATRRNRRKIKRAIKKAERIVERSANRPNSLLNKVRERQGAVSEAEKYLKSKPEVPKKEPKPKRELNAMQLTASAVDSGFDPISRIISKKASRQERRGRQQGLIDSSGELTESGVRKLSTASDRRQDRLGLDTALSPIQVAKYRGEQNAQEDGYNQQNIALGYAGATQQQQTNDGDYYPASQSNQTPFGPFYRQPNPTRPNNGQLPPRNQPSPIPSPIQPTPQPTPTTGDFQAMQRGASFGETSTQALANEGVSSQAFLDSRVDSDPVLRKLLEDYSAEAQTNIAPEEVRRNILRGMRGRIEAQNAIYGDLANQIAQQAQQRIGQQRALSARSGIATSEFGQQAMENVMDYNQQQREQLANQQNQALQQIYADADNIARTEINNLRVMKQQGGENYLRAIEMENQKMDEALQNTVRAMIARGVNPLELPEADLANIASKFGATPDKLVSFYSQLAQGQQEGFTLGEGQVRYDSQGNVIAGNTGGVGGVGGVGGSPEANSWANAILSGQAKLSDVPQGSRQSVIQALNQIPKSQTPQGEYALTQANTAMNIINDIRQNPALQKTPTGKIISGAFPGTEGKDLKVALDSLKAIIGFDELQKMRDASPTGGALGQVSEREIAFLQSLRGSLNRSQSREQLETNIQRIAESFEVLSLVNSPDGTMGAINGINFMKAGDSLVTEDNQGNLYELGPDRKLNPIESFNQASPISSVDEAIEKIGRVESGGDYQALGPVLNSGQYKGQRAIGKYQVMEGNIPQWSKLALGYSVTPEEFYNNPEIQDAVARDQFQRNYQKYGNWDDVASVWFSGRPLNKAGNARDQLGTSVPEYVRRFNTA